MSSKTLWRLKILTAGVCAMFLAASAADAQNVVRRPGKANPFSQPVNNGTKNKEGNTARKTNSNAAAPKPSRKSVEKHTSNPSSTTMFTMNRNEVVELNEYACSFRAGQKHFMAILVDTVSEVRTLVVDGKRVMSDKMLRVWYMNPDNVEELGYSYGNGRNMYIVLDNQKFGPYDYIDDYYYHPAQGYNKKRFVYTAMDREFLHDVDNTNRQLDKNNSYNRATWGVEFHSPNGMHTLSFGKGTNEVILDGKTHTISDGNNEKPYIEYVVVRNDGTAVLKTGNYDYIEIDRSGARLLKNPGGERYDITKKCYVDELKNIPMGWTLARDGMTECSSTYCKLKTDYTVTDPMQKHTFLAGWKYDYVLIDGKRFNTNCPIDARYDKAMNAFVWVTMDGQKVVENIYRL